MDYETETVGFITRKHVYEIAKVKSEDTLWQEVDLQVICKKIIDMAYRMGIKVVDKIDPEEYKVFLANQAKIVEKQKAEIQAAKEAKLLRTLT
jgi:large subunit ribosomal protein L11